MASKFQQHVAKWQDCQGCKLCHTRKRVVLLRGRVPAPVLFVGEAPGDSEDVMGYPFAGPAGHLQNQIMEAAGLVDGQYAMTNLIACIPKGDDNRKLLNPPKFAIEACEDRLLECIRLVEPKAVIWVGKEAAAAGPGTLVHYNYSLVTAEIMHPAAILRMHVSQQALAFQRNVITIGDALQEVEL